MEFNSSYLDKLPKGQTWALYRLIKNIAGYIFLGLSHAYTICELVKNISNCKKLLIVKIYYA